MPENIKMNDKELFTKLYKELKISLDTFNNLVGGEGATIKKCYASDSITHRKISVIIPTHNRIDKLMRCISSIQNQNYDNIEIIVVDDNSSDKTQEVIPRLQEENIFYVRNNESLGAGGSRKKGYNSSSGDIIIFCDDDDYYIDYDYFNKINHRFDQDDELVMLCANSIIKYCDTNSYVAKDLQLEDKLSTTSYLNNFGIRYDKPNSTFTMALNKKIIENNSFGELLLFNDTSLYLYALLARGTVGYLKDYIGIYEIHQSNMSSNISTDFLIDNLDSKNDIYHKAKKKLLLENPEFWIYEQVNITIMYFIYGSKPNYSKVNKVSKWINSKMKGRYRVKLLLKIYYAFCKMKLR